MNHFLTPVVIAFSCLLGSFTASAYAPRWMARVVEKKACVESLGSVVADPKECWSWTRRETAQPVADISSSRIFIGGSDGWLHIVDPSKGKTLQRVALEGNLISAPVFSDEVAIFGTDTGFAYSLLRDALTVEWKTELDAGILQTPFLTKDSAFFVTQLGTIYALSIKTGEVSWFKKRDLPNRIFLRRFSMPLMISSQVNGSSRDLLVIGNPNGKLEYLDPSNGEVIDETLLANTKEPFTDVATTAILDRGLFYAAAFNYGLVAIDAESRARKWDFKERGITQLALQNGVLVVAGPKFVYGLNPDTGRTIWKFTFARGAPSPITIDDGEVCLGSDTDGLYILDLFSGYPKQVLGSGLGFAGGAKRFGQSWLALSSAGVLFLFDSTEQVVGGKRAAR